MSLMMGDFLFTVRDKLSYAAMFSTRCWIVSVGISDHSATGALVRSDSDVGMLRRLQFQFIPEVFSGVESESGLCAGHSSSSTFSNLHLHTMSSWSSGALGSCWDR
ncbi:hypothetical protein QTP86_030029, partial [Hemibagrus guttatus]